MIDQDPPMRMFNRPSIIITGAFLLVACGSGDPRPGTGVDGGPAADAMSPADANDPNHFGAITGAPEGWSFPIVYAGVGELWSWDLDNAKWLRYGQNVSLADLPSFCERLADQPAEVRALSLWLQDTEPASYEVVEHGAQVGTRVATAYFTGRKGDADLPKLRAVAGTVVLESLAPSTSEPLTEPSVAQGTFTLSFRRDANQTIECTGGCQPTGCTFSCQCRRPDGGAFQCTTSTAGSSCCNDGNTATETVTGRFTAPLCRNQCACLANAPITAPPCPCAAGWSN